MAKDDGKPTWLGLRQQIAELEREVAAAKKENEKWERLAAALRKALAEWGEDEQENP